MWWLCSHCSLVPSSSCLPVVAAAAWVLLPAWAPRSPQLISKCSSCSCCSASKLAAHAAAWLALYARGAVVSDAFPGLYLAQAAGWLWATLLTQRVVSYPSLSSPYVRAGDRQQPGGFEGLEQPSQPAGAGLPQPHTRSQGSCRAPAGAASGVLKLDRACRRAAGSGSNNCWLDARTCACAIQRPSGSYVQRLASCRTQDSQTNAEG